MKRITLALCLTLSLAVLSSCGKKEGSPTSGLSTKNNVVYWILSDISRLHPYVAVDADASYVYQGIWEPLNGVQPRTQELIPLMASLPEIAADHLTYTYTMNPKAHWSDGKPLDGRDVIFSFKAVMNPLVVNSQNIRNYVTSVDSVYLVNGDPGKVAFHLNKPYFMMDRVLGGGYIPIMPKHVFDPENLTDQMKWPELKQAAPSNPAIKKWATFFESPALARDPKYQIGSGPLVYKEWITSDHITLKKDPNYWGKDVPWAEFYPDEVIFKTINDYNATVTALKAKDIDFVAQLSPAVWMSIDTTKQRYIKKDSIYINQVDYIAWNNTRPLFSDKRVRRALAMLVDRQTIIHQVLKDIAKINNTPIAFTQPNYVDIPGAPTFDPAGAKKMLAEAGWTDSDGDGVLDKTINGKKTPFHFTFLLNSGNEWRKQTALIVGEEMRKVGIKVDINATEASVWLENVHSHQFDATVIGLSGNASEDDLYQTWHSSESKNKGSNWYSFINPTVDSLLVLNRTEFDYAKRKEYTKQIETIIMDEQPLDFLWVRPLLVARVDRFDNVEFFRQRPGINFGYWIVRGSGVKPLPDRPSTIMK